MLTWSHALAWRLRRHLLDPVGSRSVAEVVHTLGAVPAQHDAAAELAVNGRRAASRAGDVERALADGELLRTFAFRGATHLMTPEDAGTYLALRAASRMWELPSWQSHYGLAPTDWPAFRETVRDALADGPLTFDELAAAVTGRPAYRHLAATFSWTLVKPLAWQGDLSLGRSRAGVTAFQRLDANPRWTGLRDLDDAGRRAVEAYLRVYGPAAPAHLQYWLGEGLGAGRQRIRSWLDDLGERVAPVDVEGDAALLLRADLDDLAAATPTPTVRLLPRYDPWVLGPGTADHRVVPPAARPVVGRGANLVIVGGVVSGTWSRGDGVVDVTWFDPTPRAAPEALAAEVDRIAAVVGADLRLGRG